MKRRSPGDFFLFELFCRRRFFDTYLALFGDPPSTVIPRFFGTHRVTVATALPQNLAERLEGRCVVEVRHVCAMGSV